MAFNANNPVSNQPTNSEGVEFEMRYVPTDKLSLVATYSNAERVLTPGGTTFIVGAADMNVDPATLLAVSLAATTRLALIHCERVA